MRSYILKPTSGAAATGAMLPEEMADVEKSAVHRLEVFSAHLEGVSVRPQRSGSIDAPPRPPWSPSDVLHACEPVCCIARAVYDHGTTT